MVTALFKEGQKAATTTSLQKYDYGEVLRIKGLSLPRYVAVQFAVDGMSEALPSSIGETVEGVTDVLIPNSLLRSNINPWNYNIMAYVYIVSGSSGKTEYTITIPVKWRPKTGDDQAADDDVAAVIGAAVEKMNTATTKAENAANQASATAEEIKADREKITTNEVEISGLKGDIANIPLGNIDIVNSMVASAELKKNYNSGAWKHIENQVTWDAGKYVIVIQNANLSSVGYLSICGKSITAPFFKYTDDGIYVFDIAEPTEGFVSMQVSLGESVEPGEYSVRYSIYKNDETIIPKVFTGLDNDKEDLRANIGFVSEKVANIQSNVSPLTDNIILNLIDFDAITYNISDKYTGCFVNSLGVITANQWSSAYCVTDYFLITEKGLTINYGVGNVYAALYDANKNFIPGSSVELRGDGVYVPYMEGAVFARFTLNNGNVGRYCIVHGSVPYSIGAGDAKFSDELVEAFTGFSGLSVVAPERLVLQKGKQTVVYLENMFKNSSILPKFASQSILTNIGNIAYGTPLADANSSVSYRFEDCLGRKSDIKKTYSVVSPPNSEALNILCVGDSFTDIGTYVGTIKEDIEEDGIAVNQIGNMGTIGKRHEARSGGTWDFVTTRQGRAIIVDVAGVTNAPTTGYPGTTYQDENGFKWSVRGVILDSSGNGKIVLVNFNVDSNYGGATSGTTTDADAAADAIPVSGTLTKTANASTGSTTSSGDETISYNGVEKIYYNPFWNPGTEELDFAYYIAKWGYNSPDVVVFSLGYNDVGANKYHTVSSLAGIIVKAKTAVDRMHTDYPDAKIVLNVNPMGYSGNTSNEISESMRANNNVAYYEALVEAFGESTDYSAYLAVCPSFMFVDREEAYNTKTVTIGRRISKTITTTGDPTHCNAEGMKQIGDAIVPYIYYLLKS